LYDVKATGGLDWLNQFYQVSSEKLQKRKIRCRGILREDASGGDVCWGVLI